MAEFAPVAPPKLLQNLKIMGALGNYHLLLAHDVVAQRGLYEHVFLDDANFASMYIIMDNSLVELGKPVGMQTMLEADRVIKSDVIVLPDFLEKGQETFDASHTYAHVALDVCPYWSFMYVMQGTTIDEAKDFLDKALEEIPHISAIGVPRVMTKRFGSRMIPTKMALNRNVSVHLLGFSDDMLDDICCARLPGVRGIDSAVPLRMGLEGAKLDPTQLNHSPRGNYWDTAENLTEGVLENLTLIRSWVKTPLGK
jgi:hypothetical protein